VKKDMSKAPQSVDLQDEAYVRKATECMPDIGKRMEYLLNTGNLLSRNTLDLSQTSGFTVVAEKLNFFRWGYLLSAYLSVFW
jgi:DNA-directed RNA polymerase I subunit RPA2